jgi:hypothetical protein
MVNESPADRGWSTALRQHVARLTQTDSKSSPDSVDISADTVCTLLGNDRRRATLKHLATFENEAETTLGELARWLASQEYDIAPEQVSQDQRKSVYISLRQNHFPKLAQTDLLEWDTRSGDISPGPSVATIAALIELIEAACEDSEALANGS